MSEPINKPWPRSYARAKTALGFKHSCLVSVNSKTEKRWKSWFYMRVSSDRIRSWPPFGDQFFGFQTFKFTQLYVISFRRKVLPGVASVMTGNDPVISTIILLSYINAKTGFSNILDCFLLENGNKRGRNTFNSNGNLGGIL